ncbi:hypothetical protein GCM10010430_79630 [Kitasatospora cystarginea]|uniref:DUF6841 domain-containing protein n=1 Tax=Kitasatospora cystarginea TaxID=58350 RepID=A0ABP5S0N4_9ACTN
MSRTDLSLVEENAKQWFERYATTFIELAGSGATDATPLLEYFAVPLTMTTSTAHLTVTTTEQLTAALGQEILALCEADYGSSQALDQMIRVLNDRSALIEVTWARYTRAGSEFQRTRVLYLVARTAEGWRITAASVLAP